MDRCLLDILNFFKEKTGIVFEKRLELLEKKIVKFYKDLNFIDCKIFLEELKRSNELFQYLVNFLTVSESYFFREKEHFEFIIEEIKKDKSKKYRFLSLPSASGEEPYTLLIYLLEEKIFNFEIVAADINSKVIEIAKTGIYPKRRLIYTPKNILDKYFVKVGDSFMIKDDYIKKIDFINQNLFDNSIYKLGKFDFILCRNLFIYFDQEKRLEALDIFYNLLNNNGFLILGHADIVKSVKNFEILKYKRFQILKKI